MRRVRLIGNGMLRRVGCSITIPVLLSVLSLCPKVTLAECLWPDFPDEPLSDGDTVTCTGITGTFVSDSTGVMVNVMSGAVVNALQLGPANHVRNFGEVHTMLFLGSDFTTDNFGTVANAADASEYTPGGAILTYVNGPGTINNGVFMLDPYDPAASVGEVNTSGDYMAGIFVRDPTAHIDISNDMAYGFDPVLDPDTGEQVVDDQGNPVYEEVIRQGSITTSGIGAHGIYIVNDEAPGSVGISNNGFIETQGPESAGVFVAPLYDEIPLSQEVRVDNGEVGSIMTNGQDAQGILVYAGDVQILNGGVIETREAYSAGIEAIGLTSISVINWGDGRISTQGLTFSPGIAAGGHKPLAGSTVQNNGNIATIGADSPGIVVLGSEYGDNHIVTSTCGDGVSCSITTTGDGSAGIQLGLVLDLGDPELDINAPSTGGEVNNGGIISTQGFFAPGIATLGTSNEAYNLPDGSIATIGDGSPGIQLNGGASAGTNFGDIETHGMASSGIQVIGKDGQVENLGIIETYGMGSSGISGSGGNSIELNHSSGLIQTYGLNSPGIELDSFIGQINVEAPIGTTGENSDGVRGTGAVSSDLSQFLVTITSNGSIVTSARNADGIAVNAGNTRIVTAGDIQTYGDYAQGIQLDTFDSVVQNSGGIATIGDFAQGISVNASKDDRVNTIDNLTDATIVTVGADAAGILALDSLYQISNYGGISTSGDRSDGIWISTLGAIENMAEPLVINNSGEITVAGVDAVAVRVDTKFFEDTNIENTPTGRIISNGIAILADQGYENHLVNRGLIEGDIRLGTAKDIVTNDGVINGNVELGGMGDVFARGPGSTVNGIVDAGELDEESEDTLNLNTLSGNEIVDGSKYVNFEITHVGGEGAMTLNGTLATDLTTVDGVTFYVDGRLESVPAGVNVVNGGVLGGNGTIVADVDLEMNSSGSPGGSIGSLTIDGDLFLNGGVLEFEADSLFEKDELLVSGNAILNEGFIDVILDFTPEPEDVLEFLLVQGTIDILDGFGGVRGVAAAGSGVELGTQFTMALGDELYLGFVTSAVPIPPSVWLFCSGLLGLVGIARRKKAF